MVNWESFGVSTAGPGHIRSGLPNQDSFAERKTSEYDCIVVSDGVGSLSHSDLGSKKVCEAVLDTVSQIAEENFVIDNVQFLMKVQERYLEKIAPLTTKECSATCLFALKYAGKVFMAMLGDGLIAVQMMDGSLKILSDNKAESFSNLVSAFIEETKPEDWKILCMEESLCRAIVLCTDGIGDDLVDVGGFMNGFIEEYTSEDIQTAIRNVQAMLENWPVPKHSDDKTIACLFRREVLDAKP